MRLGLRELYAWYRDTEPMTANILRDAGTVPALGPLVERGLRGYLGEVHRVLTGSIRARGRRRERVAAAGRVAIDFHIWRALAPLGDVEAAELAAGFIELAASTGD